MSNEKFYTPVDVQKALKERLVKFETQLRDLHVRELRKDLPPGPGAPPQAPPEQPVGSSHGIPQGQLQDLCPMCGQPDQPGQCQCLNGGGNEGLDQPVSQPGSTNTPGMMPAGDPLALKEWEKPWEKKAEASVKKGADFIDPKGKSKMVGNHPDAVLPDDKKPKKVKSADDAKIKKAKGLSKAGIPNENAPEEPTAKVPQGKQKQPLNPTSWYTPGFGQAGSGPPDPNRADPLPGEPPVAGIPKDDFLRALQEAAKGRKPMTGKMDMNSGPDPRNTHLRHALQAKVMANQALGKVAVPMAKPPGGGTGLAPKPPAMAKPVAPKVGAPGAAPKALGKTGPTLAGLPTSAAGTGFNQKLVDHMVASKQQALDGFNQKGGGTNPKPPGMGKAAEPMSAASKKKQAQDHGNAVASKQAAAPKPTAPPVQRKGSEYYETQNYQKGEEKPAKGHSFSVRPGADPRSPGSACYTCGKGRASHDIEATETWETKARRDQTKELSKAMGVCLFCGNGEHSGMCGLAKNIQTSLKKAVSPILQAQPKLRAKAGKLGHVATSPELGDVQGPGGKTMLPPALPQQAGTNAGSPGRAARAMNHPPTKKGEVCPNCKAGQKCAACTK